MHAPVWLFDGVCVLCSGAVRYTLAHERQTDRPVRFVALQSARGRALAREHGLDPDDPRSFLFIEDGKVLRESDGVLGVMRQLHGWRHLTPLGRLVPRPLRDVAYRFVARHRYKLFGRSESCMAPTPDQRDRFVLPE